MKGLSTLKNIIPHFKSAAMSKNTIVVFGATGKQGGSVIKSILADSKAAAQFHVKAVTRDPAKDSSKALAALGAEVVAVGLTRCQHASHHCEPITKPRPGGSQRQRLASLGDQRRLWRLRCHQFLGEV